MTTIDYITFYFFSKLYTLPNVVRLSLFSHIYS
jgi:hypothetical protein